VVVRFNAFIKAYSDTPLAFPLGLMIPDTVSNVSTILGCCAMATVAAVVFWRRYPAEVVVVLLFTLLMAVFGQRTARFFLEPYYWCLPVLIIEASTRRWVRMVSSAVAIQAFLLIPFVGFLCKVLGEGIISDSGRERLMSSAASFYDESRWAREVLPRDAVVCTDIRSRALLPCKVFPIEYLYFTDFRDSVQVTRFLELMYRKYKVNYLVISPQGPSGVVRWRCSDSLIAGPVIFNTGTRNPYNKQPYKAFIYTVRSRPK
jgi:hypothetical protein